MTKLNLYRGSGDIPTFDHYGLISMDGWASGACQYGQDLHVIGHVGEALFEWEISDPKSASVASTMLNTRGTFDVVTAGMSSESNGKIYLALNNSKDAFDLGPLQFFLARQTNRVHYGSQNRLRMKRREFLFWRLVRLR